MTSQVAITLLKSLEQSLDSYCELNDEGKTAFSMAITALELFGNSEQLLSVQSELSNNSQKLDTENGELISRQAAMKIRFSSGFDHDGILFVPYRDVEEHLKKLPSAQPEIIRCRNCKFASGDSRICMKFGHSPIGELDFCAWAERRTDE